MATLDHTYMTADPQLDDRPSPSLLIGPPGEWPRAANRAYRSLLRDLNSWCRDTNSPPSTNPAVAEAAVRQAWNSSDQQYQW